ncbi:amidohydrolase family protein [Embleya scabrispora]|uniref:amidohydrolase family protein n=1 Tax=Embleya scabrispora TaxID=159449 RepID=UPI0003743A57|nr:amidohydrolase family protein [Embleya scabrispora]MYS85294.1 amidohydrolase family protein [Streptomyces sp. SID5474]
MSSVRARVDAHHHLWDTNERAYRWMDGAWADPLRGRFRPAELVAAMRNSGPIETIAVQAVTDTAESAELLAIAADPATPVAAVVGWVDLTAPDTADQIAVLRDGPGGERLVGIRHLVQDEPDPRWLLRADVGRSLAALTAAGLVYDLLVKPPQLAAAWQVAREHPEQSFVLDHIGKPEIGVGAWEPWATTIRRLGSLPNVAVKVSGLVTEADWRDWTVEQILPYARHALEAFGPERAMFGSDWPVCTLAASYDDVLSLTAQLCTDLSTTERDRVFGDTARAVYGI